MEYIPCVEQQIMDILIYFDFQLVQDYMKLKTRKEYDENLVKVIDKTTWKMCLTRGYDIPTIEELKEFALTLMKNIIKLAKTNPDEEFFQVKSGPFVVTYRHGILQLDAVIETYSYD